MPVKLKQCKVLVTPTSFGKEDPDLIQTLEEQVGKVSYNPTGKPLSSAALVEIIPEFDGFIAGLDEINQTVIEAAGQLKIIARYGVGVDNVDLRAAEQKGIIVTNTPGANSASVAELTVGLIIALGRNLLAAAIATRQGEWPRMPGRTLNGKVVGLLGFGSIGKNVAKIVSGYDCTILAHDISPDFAIAEQFGVQFCPNEEVISKADFLSLHCGLLPETRGMVDAEFLKKMKPGASLINTARGELIDEAALLGALDSDHLSGAALDVFAKQPPGIDNRLLSHPRVIATPHMGAHTDGAMANMGWGALNDCLAVLRGEEPVNRVV